MRTPAVIWLLLSSVAVAANGDQTDTAAQQQFPCLHDERFREFDFWLGEWDVHTGDGSLAGKNSIESAQAGCTLIERWVSTAGVPGISLNYFDVSTGEWVQVWVGAGGTQVAIRGGMTDEGMRLEGWINYVATGQSAPFRGLWTLLSDGRVRQYFEQSPDGGKTWAPWFEGFYSRADTNTNVDRK